ncbi:MAG: UbiA family prenyltransferase [Candidatus Micrarchaeia archaeon]
MRIAHSKEVCMFKKLKALYELTRIDHAVMLSVAVMIGEIVAIGSRFPDALAVIGFGTLLTSMATAFFIEIGSFALNDYADVETDKINKRMDRPLARGDLSRKTALYLSVFGFLFGLVSSLFLPMQCIIIAFLFSALSVVYNYKLKDMPLAGNAYIATTMAIPFIFGNFAVIETLSSKILVLSAIAFFVGLGREIAKTMEDVEGDRLARGAVTLPMVIGVERTAYLCSIIYMVAVILSFLPHFLFNFGLMYLIPIAVADMLLIYCMVVIPLDHSISSLHRCRVVSLVALAVGLLGFLLGGIEWALV